MCFMHPLCIIYVLYEFPLLGLMPQPPFNSGTYTHFMIPDL
uniref:Uncharacterized protein n=1 Tax=Anguilla anguilla TaxID=7936 RepID=A0A0E9XXP4_ANGAN